MTRWIQTDALKVRLAQVDALLALWSAAGDLERWQESRFVAAMLAKRIGHRLVTGTAGAATGPAPAARRR